MKPLPKAKKVKKVYKKHNDSRIDNYYGSEMTLEKIKKSSTI